MVSIKTTNVYGKEITHYEHPLIKVLIKVINGNTNEDSVISNFIKAILENAKGELTIHRDESNELVLADKFGHTFHIFDGHCYMRTYPKPEDLTHEFLLSVGKTYVKLNEWRNLGLYGTFMSLSTDERREKGFPFYGDMWELEEEGFGHYDLTTTMFGEISGEETELINLLSKVF